MKNRRERENKALIRNCIKNSSIPRRSLLVAENEINSQTLSAHVDDINELIQNINCIVHSRNIPYIRIEQQQPDYLDLSKTRVIVRSEKTDTDLLKKMVQ